MSKTLWNADHQAAVIDQNTFDVVAPGEPREFTDEEIAAGVAGIWTEVDPSGGFEPEQVWQPENVSPHADLHVSELRARLEARGIDHPAGAKKVDLIDLLDSHPDLTGGDALTEPGSLLDAA
jgi:hypothetical protein